MKIFTYRGFIIFQSGEWFRVNNACYKTLKQAKDAINQYLASEVKA